MRPAVSHSLRTSSNADNDAPAPPVSIHAQYGDHAANSGSRDTTTRCDMSEGRRPHSHSSLASNTDP